jgi:hypothetical protein
MKYERMCPKCRTPEAQGMALVRGAHGCKGWFWTDDSKSIALMCLCWCLAPADAFYRDTLA